jgi:hypothetical protein
MYSLQISILSVWTRNLYQIGFACPNDTYLSLVKYKQIFGLASVNHSSNLCMDGLLHW